MIGIPVLRRDQAIEEYEPESEFTLRLKLSDDSLEAYRDKRNQTIVIWARRHGAKVHEFTLKRQFGELWPELERRVLKTLPEKDVWKKFGSGKDFDDWLHDEEEKRFAQAKRMAKEERLARLKDERLLVAAALQEAAAGRVTKDTVRPVEIPSESFPENPITDQKQADKPKE